MTTPDDTGIPTHWNSIVNAQKAWTSGNKARAIQVISRIKFKTKMTKKDHNCFVVAADFNSGIGDRFWQQLGWTKESANQQAEALFIKHFMADAP